MPLSGLSLSTGLVGSLIEGRHDLIDLQRQLGTGKRSTTYGGLEGTSRLTVLSIRADISDLGGYNRTIADTQLRLNITQQTIGRFADINTQFKTDSLQSPFDLVDGQQSLLQQNASVLFDEMANLLNSKVGERHLFSGRETQTPPLELPDVLLNGDGVRAGLTQLISEREQADTGASGLGRLALSNPIPATVAIAEDGTHPFGLKLGAAVSSLSGVTITGPAGAPPQTDVAFSATLPTAGETISLGFTLPDGTSETLQFTAVSGTPEDATQFAIGADETATRTNFEAALQSELTRLTDTSVTAASNIQASKEFFAGSNGSPPLRVTGPPYDTATAQAAGTAADTVIFYRGDDDTGISARQSALAEIEKNVVIGYGTRANEEANQVTLAGLAVLATVNFSSADPNAQQRYQELTSRVGASLAENPGQQSFANIQGELGNVQRSLEAARERHAFSIGFAEEVISDREDVSLEEVGARILTLQTRLEASFETTSILARLTLTNFL